MTTKIDAKPVEAIGTDWDTTATLAEAAGNLAVEILNKLEPELRRKIAAAMEAGRLTVIVTVSPRLEVVLALDPNDPRRPPVRLAHFHGVGATDLRDRILH